MIKNESKNQPGEQSYRGGDCRQSPMIEGEHDERDNQYIDQFGYLCHIK